MTRILEADNLTGAVAFHAEGPVWSASWGGLRWVDMLNGELLTYRSGAVHRLPVGGPVAAFVRPRAGGGYVVGTERGIAFADDVDSPPTRRVELWTDEGVRMNDGTATPDGRLLAGSMAYDGGAGRGTLYVVEPDLSASAMLPGVTISNGIEFSPDGSRAYYVDSRTRCVQVFDYRDGRLTNGRTFVAIDPSDGLPDGLTVAADGSVWVALWGGSAVHGYDHDGQLGTIVNVPVTQVSACSFGGPELDTLFVTTSRQNLAADEQPEAGSVFQVKPGVAGLPAATFSG